MPASSSSLNRIPWGFISTFTAYKIVCYSIDGLFRQCHNMNMEWDVLFTDEFEQWWNGLTEGEQDSVDVSVLLLLEHGPMLAFPHSSGIRGSRYPHMRELRIQHAGRPYRVLYAFNPERNAILLIGGNKIGNDRWYEEYIPIADRLYAEHLAELAKEKKRRKGS